jgi:hypothetical protein
MKVFAIIDSLAEETSKVVKQVSLQDVLAWSWLQRQRRGSSLSNALAKPQRVQIRVAAEPQQINRLFVSFSVR